MMNKEEIRHFKSLLRQGSLRHMNIVLDDKFQKELLNVIKDYENLQQRIDKAIEYNKQIIKDTKSFYRPTADTIYSGDCLIDIAEQNIKMLEGKE